MPIFVLDWRAGLEPKNQNDRQWQCPHWFGSIPAVQTKEITLHRSPHLPGLRIVSVDAIPANRGQSGDIRQRPGRDCEHFLRGLCARNLRLTASAKPGDTSGVHTGAQIREENEELTRSSRLTMTKTRCRRGSRMMDVERGTVPRVSQGNLVGECVLCFRVEFLGVRVDDGEVGRIFSRMRPSEISSQRRSHEFVALGGGWGRDGPGPP